MTQKEKQLLLKDLCARLPYGVEIVCEASKISLTLSAHMLDEIIKDGNELQWKPYLRPMSSMTEEECITLSRLKPYDIDAWKYIKTPVPLYIANIEQFNFFHRHHLDWRGLIPKGLALEASKDMYKTE